MSKTIKANQGAVTSIGDTDLVMVEGANGGYRPISFSALMAAIRGGIQIGGRNLLKNTIDKKVTSSTLTWFATYPSSDELLQLLPLTLSCKYHKIGNPSGSISLGAAVAENWFPQANLTKESISDSGTLVVYLNSNTYQKISIFAQSTTGVELYDFKLERGNMATDWTPAPEDLSDLWGG